MQIKNVAILCLIVAVLSAAGTRFLFPKVESRNVEIEKEVVRTDTRTVTRIIERPDGTKETIVDSVDKSVKKETSSKESTVFQKSNYIVDLSARTKIDELQFVYELQVQKRILGPVFLGLKAGTDKSVGASVGLEF